MFCSLVCCCLLFVFFGFFGFGFGFFIFLFVVFAPLVGVEGRIGYAGDVDHDALGVQGFEGGAADVGRGSLQAVEKQAGGFVIEVARDDKLQDLHEGDLDGLGVLEDGQVDGAGSCAARRINEEAVRYADIVKIAEAAGAEGGRAALGAVGLDVLTTLNFHDECSTPSPLVIFKNHQVRVGSLYKILITWELHGKS